MDLSDLLAGLSEDGSGGYAVEPPDEWRQGRTLYGGLTTALCTEAAHRLLGSPPPLRSVQNAFVGPAAGRVRLRPTLLRQGRSAAFVGVDAVSDAGTCARATLTYAVARDSEFAHDRSPVPEVPRPEDCPPLPAGLAPPFLGQFDVRFAGGGVPFSGTDESAVAMWVRHRSEGPIDPTVALVAVADVLPPADSPALRAGRPMSSMTWSMEILRAPERIGWYLLRAASEHFADGYSVQTMGCWDHDGQCLALGRQTVALF